MANPPPSEDKSFDPRLRFNDGAAYENMMGRWSVLSSLRLWRCNAEMQAPARQVRGKMY